MIQNQLFVKKTHKKLIDLKWPGVLFHNQSSIKVSGSFFCKEENIPLLINESTPFHLIPFGYLNLFSHFQYLKEKLFFSTFNHFNNISKRENHDAFKRIRFCNGYILETFQIMLKNFEKLPEIDYNEFVDDWKTELVDWLNVGIFSGSWENFETFVNKRSLIIEDNLFLISNPSNYLNQILFHPFVDSESISNIQKTFWPNENYIESKI